MKYASLAHYAVRPNARAHRQQHASSGREAAQRQRHRQGYPVYIYLPVILVDQQFQQLQLFSSSDTAAAADALLYFQQVHGAQAVFAALESAKRGAPVL